VINTGIPAILSALSNDLILVCDEHYIIQEVNPLATDMLGESLVGQSFLHILHDSSQSKGQGFLEHIARIGTNNTSDSWELLFNVPRDHPMLITMRAGTCDQHTWLFVGTCESPQLTALYHEVLAMNSQLTNLIRQLSKEQARLHGQLVQLLETQEHHYG
jgi:hypothetical protein